MQRKQKDFLTRDVAKSAENGKSRRSTGDSMSLIPPEGVSFYGEKPTQRRFSLTECIKSVSHSTPRLLPITSPPPLKLNSEEQKNEFQFARERISPKLSPLPLEKSYEKSTEEKNILPWDHSPESSSEFPQKLSPLMVDKSKESAKVGTSDDLDCKLPTAPPPVVPISDLASSLSISRHRARRGSFAGDIRPQSLEPRSVSPKEGVKRPLKFSASDQRRGSLAESSFENEDKNYPRRHSMSEIPVVSQKGDEDNQMPEGSFMGWEIIQGIKRHKNWSCQDRLVLLTPHRGSCMDRAIFGVCDGHGTEGHKAAEFCALNVYSFLRKSSLKHSSSNSISRAIQSLHHSLVSTKTDYRYSGSTLCCGLFDLTAGKLKVINIGDSRCCLIQNNYIPNDPHSYQIVQMSYDHKPNAAGERCRIESSGGVIQKCAEKDRERLMNNRSVSLNDFPYRVWRPFQDLPGIAMSRSIGDTEAKKLGVTCEPEIREHKLKDQDQYLIVASDGIWDIYSNQQVLNYLLPLLRSNAEPSKMAKMLCKSAQRKWLESRAVTDDISCVIVNIPALLAVSSVETTQKTSITVNK